MKFFLLLGTVSALNLGRVYKPKVKPICKDVNSVEGHVGSKGEWKFIDESQFDKLPEMWHRGPASNPPMQAGCDKVAYKKAGDKFMVYEPHTCRLPYKAEEVKNMPRRFLFVGDSVQDEAAVAMSWFLQKENRVANQNTKPCTFKKDQMERRLKASGKFEKHVINKAAHWMVQQGGFNRKRGHLWWGCKNSSVMYAPIMTFDAPNQQIIKAWAYTLQNFGGDTPLGPEDVVVLNFGLHGIADGKAGNLAKMEETWIPSMTTFLNEWKEWKANGTAPKLIWREVSPQHFGAPDGHWNHDNGGQCKAIGGNKDQIAEDPTKFPLRSTNMFKKAVEDAGLEIDGKDIAFMPVWRVTSERFDEHPWGDCTHYCYFGAVNRYWNSALLVTASGMLQQSMPEEPKKVSKKKATLKKKLKEEEQIEAPAEAAAPKKAKGSKLKEQSQQKGLKK